MTRAVRLPLDRFLEKVDQQGPIPPGRPDLGPCWLWRGAMHPLGYGRFSLEGTKDSITQASRAAWILLRGPIPEGHDVDHLCRVRACVNVEHLEPVTRGENVRRGDSPTGRAARRTHCKRGHPFDEANTFYTPDGHRACRACRYQSVLASARRYRDGDTTMRNDPPASDLGAIRKPLAIYGDWPFQVDCPDCAWGEMPTMAGRHNALLEAYRRDVPSLLATVEGQAARLAEAQALLERFVEHPVPTAADFEAAEDWLSAGAVGAGEARDG
jgi:hypothetical protein